MTMPRTLGSRLTDDPCLLDAHHHVPERGETGDDNRIALLEFVADSNHQPLVLLRHLSP